MQSGREAVGQLLHLCRDPGGHFQRIGIWGLVNGDPGSRLAVQLEVLRIGLGAEVDTRDVFYFDQATALRGLVLDDDFRELTRIVEPRQDVDRVLELLILRRGRHADLTGRHLLALLLDSIDHVLRHEVERIQLLRIHPDPHRVLARAHYRDVAHAGRARELVDQVDRRVIPHKERIA